MREFRTWTWPLALAILAVAISLAGRSYVRGFSILGPILLSGPFVFLMLAFGLMLKGAFAMAQRGQTPPRDDVDLIEKAATDHNLGQVSVVQIKAEQGRKLVLMSPGQLPRFLPENWNDLPLDARRFAVVRTLLDANPGWLWRNMKPVLFLLEMALGMAVAGVSLWTVPLFWGVDIVLHLSFKDFRRRRSILIRDRRALAATKDLQAALRFANADPENRQLRRGFPARIAALRETAHRLNIPVGSPGSV